MENDPNKKESKGKRLLKKALRRSSKSSNSSTNESSVSRSKSFESKPAPAANDSAPLPEPKPANMAAIAFKKTVDIQEQNNTIHEDETPASMRDLKQSSQDEYLSEPSTSKKIVKRKAEEESAAGTSGASAGNSDNDADDKDSKDKKKKNRCAVCRKKVGLTGFECRCGGLFCAVHRYSDKHECSFDYRELGAQEIRRNNPVVVSQKIHKI